MIDSYNFFKNTFLDNNLNFGDNAVLLKSWEYFSYMFKEATEKNNLDKDFHDNFENYIKKLFYDWKDKSLNPKNKLTYYYKKSFLPCYKHDLLSQWEDEDKKIKLAIISQKNKNEIFKNNDPLWVNYNKKQFKLIDQFIKDFLEDSELKKTKKLK